MIAAMEDEDDDNTSPEWIAYNNHLCLLENSMNPMENLLVTIMLVNGATCDLAKGLQFEVVFIQMVITFFLHLVGSTGDPMENLPTWTMKELAEGIAEMLAPMLNHLAMIICNVQVNCKHLDFVHLQMVTYPNRVDRPDVDDSNYADF